MEKVYLLPSPEELELEYPNPSELPQQIEGLVSNHGLDTNLARLFSPDVDSIYGYDGTDSGFQEYLKQLKSASLAELNMYYTEAYDKGISVRLLEGASREYRRRQKSSDIGRRLGAAAMDTFASTEEGKEWINETLDLANEDLPCGELISTLAETNALHYFRQVDWDPHLLTDDERETVDRLGIDSSSFGPEATLGDITDSLAEKGLIDLSKETLDARVELFAATAQIEAAKLFLFGLSNLAPMNVGVMPKQAKWLAYKYKNTLLLDDYDTKVDMMADLSALCRDIAMRERHPTTRSLYSSMANWSRNASRQLEDQLANFKEVYEALGYELPAQLKPDGPEIEVPKLKLIDTDTAERMKRIIDPEEQAALKAEIETVFERANDLNTKWRMNGNARRKHGFTTMYRELVGGFRNFAGRQLLDRMGKEQAQTYIDITNHLYALTRDPDARNVLDGDLAEHDAIRSDLAILKEYADRLGVVMPRPALPPIRETIAEISGTAERWATFRQVAVKAWPSGQGLSVVRNLETLLLDEPQPIEAGELPESEVKRQLEMADYLDLVILPPNVTEEQLKHTQIRIGNETRTLDAFEWQRLIDLVRLREEFGGEIYRTKDFKKKKEADADVTLAPDEPQELEQDKVVDIQAGHKRKKRRSIQDDPSYWVLSIDFDGDEFIVAESAFTNHATYVVCERLVEGTALQALGVSRSEAPSRGAHPVRHIGKLPHWQKVRNQIVELHQRIAA